jgi:threonine/homoserine/homoserine lactone efflux protein
MHLPDFITYFFLAVAFSFFGSIPPATGNLITIQTSITKGIKASLIFALGEVIIELIYGYISLEISNLIAQVEGDDFYLKIIVIPIFAALSAYYFLNKKTVEKEARINYKTNFYYGLLIGLLNPLAIPYWIFYFSYFYSNGWIKQDSPYLYFLLAGIPVGSFLLLTTYAALGKKIVTVLKFRIELLNKSIAFVFLLMALLQTIQLLID